MEEEKVSSLLVLLPVYVVFVYFEDGSPYPRLGLRHRIKRGGHCHE
jgi:hypothetical protein